MSISTLIYWSNLVIWFLPPFRQYGGKYFGYFLILALADPITVSLFLGFHIAPVRCFMFLSYCLLVSLLNLNRLDKRSISCAAGMVLLFIITRPFNLETITVGIIILHVFILGLIIKALMIEVGIKREINFFLAALSFYEITIIIKVFAGLTKPAHYIIFYYTTTGFEILLALLFIFFRMDNRALCLKLPGMEEVQTEFDGNESIRETEH